MEDTAGPKFTVESLSARQGDCTLVEWASGDVVHRALVDGGPVTSYDVLADRLARIDAAERHLDLLVVSHVDADHIEGVLKLLNDAELGLTVADVWFNGYRHLPADELGGVQGDMFGGLLEARGLPWNAAFDGQAVRRPRGAAPPVVHLPGGMDVTVLAPSDTELAALRPVWTRECRRAGLVAGDVEEALTVLRARKRLTPAETYLDAGDRLQALAEAASDTDGSEANASSITLLFERGGSSALLSADATPEPLRAGLDALLSARRQQRMRVDLLKLPHHGSERNVTKHLLQTVAADTYVVSTDGSYHDHPDAVAMARLLCYGTPRPTVVFTHRSATTEGWGDPALVERYGHRPVYPEGDATGVSVPV